MTESDAYYTLVCVAKLIIYKKIDFLRGTREICLLTNELQDRNEYPIAFFRAIESETDSFIDQSDNQNIELYSQEFLNSQRVELEEYFKMIHSDIMRGAQEIINRYSNRSKSD